MKLELDPTDLAPEFQEGKGENVDQKCSTRDVTFDKLNPKAQKAVRVVGRATFFSWDRKTYNVIRPPE